VNHRDVGRPVTVGVADKQQAAVAYAAEEARLHDCALRIVHAYTVPPTPPQVVSNAYGFDINASFKESGREVLVDAADRVSVQHDEVTVHQVLEQGPASTVLAASSVTSRLLVLGSDAARPWYTRLFRSRVSRDLAQQARCPVIVVPDVWRAESAGTGVTLLLDSETVAHGPLRYAFEHASRHDEVLHVVHVEAVDGSHDENVPWHDMHRLVESWKATYPHVWVTTKVVRADADVATVVTFERTGLLVLGRPHTRHAVPCLHPSLAQAVIEHADCPVAVVPADYDA
jgi:nucleotide-binding universal stress UspA family protein